MLRWVGHDRAAVLDGGWEGWEKGGFPVTTTSPAITPVIFTGEPRGTAWVDAQFVRSHLNDPSVIVLDARAPERFKGIAEPIDPVAGRIPGARNRLFKDNLDADGRFKSAHELKAAFESVLAGARAGQVVHQCGSGVSACSNLLAMEIAGLTGSKLYPGSWSEWIADPERPIAKG
jgi:thiosulfate/3-mercaptopyruvate sulfurtransferase